MSNAELEILRYIFGHQDGDFKLGVTVHGSPMPLSQHSKRIWAAAHKLVEAGLAKIVKGPGGFLYVQAWNYQAGQ